MFFGNRSMSRLTSYVLGTDIVVMRHDRIGLVNRYIGNRRAAPA